MSVEEWRTQTGEEDPRLPDSQYEENLLRISELEELKGNFPTSAGMRNLQRAQGFVETAGAVLGDPLGTLAPSFIRSMTSQAAPLAAGAIAGTAIGSVPGALVGTGVGSGVGDAISSFTDFLRRKNVNLQDPQSLRKALRDPEVINEAAKYAGLRGAIIGATSALGGAVAGRVASLPARTIAGRTAAIAGDVGIQAAMEGGGESGAQLATTGTIDPKEVALEMTVGLPFNAAETAIGGLYQEFQQRKKARAEQPRAIAPVTLRPSADPAVKAVEEEIIGKSESMVKPARLDQFLSGETISSETQPEKIGGEKENLAGEQRFMPTRDAESEVPAVEETPEGDPISDPSGASVPVMITRRMEADLRTRGFTQEQINAMTPTQAWENLQETPTAEQAPEGEPATKPVSSTITQEEPTDAISQQSSTEEMLRPEGARPIQGMELQGMVQQDQPEIIIQPQEAPQISANLIRIASSPNITQRDLAMELQEYTSEERSQIAREVSSTSPRPDDLAKALKDKYSRSAPQESRSLYQDEPSEGGRTDKIDELVQEEENINLGPGAANALEFALMPKRTTSTKNIVTNTERAARGDLEVLREAIQTNQETFQMALDRFNNNPNAGTDLVKSLLEGTKGDVSEVDEAVLLKHKVDLMNEREMEYERIADPYNSEEEREAVRERWKDLENKINLTDQATRKSGTIWGRMGQFRQRLMRDDYTFEAMERKARVSKDRPLTSEESDEIKQLSERIADLESQLEEASSRSVEKDAEKVSESEFKRLKRESEKKKIEDKRSGKKPSLEEGRKRIIAALRSQKEQGDKPENLRQFIQKLALNLVRDGINEREELIDTVHSIVNKIFPEVNRPKIRDLISGYGDFKPLDKEPAKVTLRGLKGEMQQIGKLEDMMSKKAPQKTGIERRQPTDEERRLIKEVNELKKKGGFEVTDPETQLKSALSAIKTRLQNEIRDLENAIINKEPLVKKDGTIQYDAEAEALRKERDIKKEEYSAIFPKDPLTNEQRILQTSKSLDRSIENLQEQIKSGKLYTEAKVKITSPELEVKRARLNALREERENLRNLDTAVIEAKKEAALMRAIERAQQLVPEPLPGVATVDTKRITELKQKLQEVREARANSPETQKKKIDTATEAVKKSIAEYDRRLQEADYSPREVRQGPLSPELEALRAERDAMRDVYRELVETQNPQKTPDEIRLQSYKTRTANRIADLQERLVAGDFDQPYRAPLQLDNEAQRLQYDLNETKREFNRARFLDALKRRNPILKVWHGVRDTLNTARAIMTSMDFSAVLRQGGFITLGNPIRAFKRLPSMFKAFSSPQQQFKTDMEIRSRPNFDLGEKSGLYISDPNSPDINKMEEAYMSRWAEKIPLVAGSQRAYTTFLNALRADSFDAMVKTLGKGGAVTPDEAKAIANFVNVATGRGNLAGSNKAGADLNALFFAPRLVMSRFELLTGAPLAKGGSSLRVRAQIAKEYAKFLIGIGVVYALAQAAGFEVEWDPRSSDFGKIKIGNTRIDPLSGLSQVSVLMARLGTGEKITGSGKLVPIRWSEDVKIPYGGGDAAILLSNFTRSKLSPPVAGLVDLLSGRNIVGEPATPISVATRMVVPLAYSDIKDAMVEQGIPEGTALGLLSMFGWGVNTYETKKSD